MTYWQPLTKIRQGRQSQQFSLLDPKPPVGKKAYGVFATLAALETPTVKESTRNPHQWALRSAIPTPKAFLGYV